MTISMILATDKNGCIGKNNTLPFNSKKDMKHFVNLTKGHDVIMGRKTWDSLPKKPLPNRRNIIITRQDLSSLDSTQNNIQYVNSIEEALEISTDPFIIGGSQIYYDAEKYADILYLTEFPDIKIIDGDTYFNYNKDLWFCYQQSDTWDDKTRIIFKTLKKVAH